MSTHPDSLRPWQIIAKELAVEKDPKKILDLSEELTHALEVQAPAVPEQKAG